MGDGTKELRAAVSAVAGADRSGWSGSARSAALVGLLEARERLDALILAVAGEWQAAKDWAADGARSPVAWIAHRAPLTRQAAATLVRTARHVHAHAQTAKAVEAGDVTAAHVEVAARGARHREEHYPDHEDVILDAARALPPSAFRNAMAHWARCVDAVAAHAEACDHVAGSYLEAHATFEGVGHLEGRLDPVSFHALIDRLDALEPPDPREGPHPPRTQAQRRAAALMRLVHGERPGRARIDVLVDVDTLGGRPPLDLTTGCCELTGFGPVSPALAQTLACDGAIGRVLMRGASEVLDLGRRTRLVTPALRRMLEIRDGGCVEEGCDEPPAWCDAHHIRPWWAHGPTDPGNVELRCRRHHLAVHAPRAPNGTRAHPPRAPARRRE